MISIRGKALSRVATIYLSKEENDRFQRVCEKENCTPYSLVKRTVLDHIMAYPMEKNGKVDLIEPIEVDDSVQRNKNQSITNQGESTKIVLDYIEPEKVSDKVKKILEGKKNE